MYITLNDLGRFILFCIFAVAGVLLIIVMLRINSFVKCILSTYKNNSDNIDKTLSTLPTAISNINDVTASVKSGLDKAGSAIDSISEAAAETASAITEGTPALISYLKIIIEVVNFVRKLFK